MLVPAAPDYSALIPAVTRALESDNSKLAYSKALERFFGWYSLTRPADGLSRTTIMAYREYLHSLGLSSSTVNLALSAIKKLCEEAAANGWLDEVTAYHCASVKCLPSKPTRTGRWLTLDQSRQLLEAPDTGTVVGLRDRAALWLLLGCGLRIEEAVNVTVEQIDEIDGRVVLRDVKGKGGKVRLVPVPGTGTRPSTHG